MEHLKTIFQIEKWKNDFSHCFPQGFPWSSRPQRYFWVLPLLPKKATHVAKNFGYCKGRSQVSIDIFMASGDLLVAQKSDFLQKSVQKTWDTVNGRFWAKKPKIVILDQHICSYRWHIWTIGSGGVDMMFWGTFSPNIVARNLKKKKPPWLL